MYKTLTVAALLLAAFAFTSGSRSADASPLTSISPPIVARGKLLNQTAPIPTTAIFTPTQSGLYRLSVYSTITTSDPNSQSNWYVNLLWTDGAGSERVNNLLVGLNNTATQFTQGWAYQLGASPTGGSVAVFEAQAGQPITYSVTLENGPADNSKYSLYYTLERLE